MAFTARFVSAALWQGPDLAWMLSGFSFERRAARKSRLLFWRHRSPGTPPPHPGFGFPEHRDQCRASASSRSARSPAEPCAGQHLPPCERLPGKRLIRASASPTKASGFRRASSIAVLYHRLYNSQDAGCQFPVCQVPGVFAWAASGRSLALGRDKGLTKVLFDEATHQLIGCGIPISARRNGRRARVWRGASAPRQRPVRPASGLGWQHGRLCRAGPARHRRTGLAPSAK